MKKPLLYFSNSLEKLSSLLCANLFCSSASFLDKKIVLIPQKSWENGLISHFLTKESLSAGAGVKFSLLGEGIDLLLRKMAHSSLRFPSSSLLTLHLYHLIAKKVEQEEFLPSLKENKQEKKILYLAQQLSALFLEYGTFGKESLTKWSAQNSWAAPLLHELLLHWHFPFHIVEQKLEPPPSFLEVHLFGFPFLPSIYHLFFSKVAHHLQVYYYQLSPCATFWNDQSSTKERFLIDHHLKKQQIDPARREELQFYLRRGYPLLSNFGKVDRENSKVFEKEEFVIQEHYVPPCSTTLLGKIQRDLLEDREEEEKEEIPEDDSLLLFPASSKLREVEILFLTISRLIAENHYLPSDITIYAPDIEEYTPYIELVFKRAPFPFHIRNRKVVRKSSLCSAFFQLLCLKEKKFSTSAIFALLLNPSMQRKFHLEEKEVLQFQRWIERCNVKWGIDGKERAEILSIEEREELKAGTWEAAFETLLSSYIVLPEERDLFFSPILDFSDIELLTKCISLIRSLKKESDLLASSSLSLMQWCSYLRSLLERYFLPSEEELSFSLLLSGAIDHLLLLAPSVGEAPFPFSIIHYFLMDKIEEKEGGESHIALHSLLFSSLHLGGISEAKVIYVMGMGEGKFPRSSFASSLQEPKGGKERDFSPSKNEKERSLLLTLFLLAKNHLLISYVDIDERDGKEVAASLLIEEMLTILSRFYTIDGVDTRKAIVKKHPPFSFHFSFFAKESPLKNLSLEDYEKAVAFYLSPKPSTTSLIPEYRPSSLPLLPDTPLFTEKNLLFKSSDLFSFARHPIRHYFHKELGIFYDAPPNNNEEDFLLSSSRYSLFKKAWLYHPLDNILEKAEKRGALPPPPFKEVAIKKLESDYRELLSTLERYGSKKEELLTIELQAGCNKKEEIKKNHWLLPPLSFYLFPNQQVTIEGILPPIFSKGMLIQGDNTLAEQVKVYPLYLLFAMLNLNGYDKKVIFTKGEKEFFLPQTAVETALREYLLYYCYSFSLPSPFLPSWAEVFLYPKKGGLEKKIEQALSLPKRKIDPYLFALFSRREEISPKIIYEIWAPLLQKSFMLLA